MKIKKVMLQSSRLEDIFPGFHLKAASQWARHAAFTASRAAQAAQYASQQAQMATNSAQNVRASPFWTEIPHSTDSNF